jgi:hypothetical protein
LIGVAAAAADSTGSGTTMAHGCELRIAYKPPSGELCHVFISYAVEQKAFADLLHDAFRQRYPALEVLATERLVQDEGIAIEHISAALGDAFVGAWAH